MHPPRRQKTEPAHGEFDMRRLVLVGNGRAAEAFLRQIQHYKHDYAITMFGDGILPHKPAWYRDRQIDVRLGVRVTAIDRHARLAKGADGLVVTYDRLILAIGVPGKNGLSIPGLQTRGAIVINRSMETSDGYIYAIGGCAEVRDERWAAKLDDQALTLAARIAGESDGVELQPGRSKLFLVPKPLSDKTEKVLIA
jgi:NAD(P)H-nitrite reductase large subunit